MHKRKIVIILSAFLLINNSFVAAMNNWQKNSAYYTSKEQVQYADYTNVDKALQSIPNDLSLYTSESIQNLNNAKNAVIRGKDKSEQNIVDGYAVNIYNAILGLVYKSADYTYVDSLISTIPKDLTLYTSESVDNLNNIKNSIDRDKKINEQAIVDGYASALKNALSNLTFQDADYSQVDQALTLVPDDLSGYSEESRKKLESAINSVIRNKKINEQAIVDGYYKNIINAIKGLNAKIADYSSVNQALNKIPKDLTIYTDESVKKLTEMKNQIVPNRPITEQSSVNKYAENILMAIDNLVLRNGNYTELDKVLSNIPSNLDIYTEESVTKLKNLVSDIDRDKNIKEQDIIDKYCKLINEAIEELELIEADYSMVDDILESIPDDLSIYSDESVERLNKAINSVVRGKTADEQNVVNAYAVEINDAIKKLVLKNQEEQNNSTGNNETIEESGNKFNIKKATIILVISLVVSGIIVLIGYLLYRDPKKKRKNKKIKTNREIEKNDNLQDKEIFVDKVEENQNSKDEYVFIDESYDETFDDIKSLSENKNSAEEDNKFNNDLDKTIKF